ncbi:MAG: CopG family transcriptional regulator [Firmicutes bacterium]|nr:CopG family transcriptional regulator [Bacillota bacterium]
MGGKKQVKVWLPPELIRRLKLVAAVEGLSLSKTTQRLLETALDRRS